jgi:dTDP-4-amino-4,6-dideoxygalactose transaminase
MKKVASALPYFEDEDIKEILTDVKQILETKRMVLGPYTQKLEKNFGDYIGTKYAVAVSSCSAALEIVLKFCNVKDHEVIVPTNTFIACPNSIIYSGGKPVFADINPETFCMDFNDIKKKITPKTKAIMVVHLGGQPQPEMIELKKICDEKGIFLIEDASHAHGATLSGKKLGSLGLAGCFSFFATKILSTGTGGIITTDDPELQKFAEAMRHQGGIGGEGQIEQFDKFGFDWMMSEITAAIGISQLSKLDKQNSKRQNLAKYYYEKLKNHELVKPLHPIENTTNVFWRFITVLDEKLDRNFVRSELRTKYNIDGGILYPVLCHLQPVYRNLGHKEGECPIAEKFIKRQLTLPINPFMDTTDIDYVVDSLNKVIASSRN